MGTVPQWDSQGSSFGWGGRSCPVTGCHKGVCGAQVTSPVMQPGGVSRGMTSRHGNVCSGSELATFPKQCLTPACGLYPTPPSPVAQCIPAILQARLGAAGSACGAVSPCVVLKHPWCCSGACQSHTGSLLTCPEAFLELTGTREQPFHGIDKEPKIPTQSGRAVPGNTQCQHRV